VKSSVLALIRAHWGLGSRTLSDIFPAGEDAAAAAAFAQIQRVSASAEVAADLLEECYRTDVREVLPTLRVPTLVLHRHETQPLLDATGGFLTSENRANLPLSPREREVVALVARGLSNRELPKR